MIKYDHKDMIAQIKLHEGVELMPYLDTKGLLTIGVGRNLQHRGISMDEAEYLLSNDLKMSERECEEAFPWFKDLDAVRQRVIVDMHFNMGLSTLDDFVNTLGMVERGEYENAARGMLNSLWASQVGNRAKRLAAAMRTGEWKQ